jgi:hypothetical protein
MMASWRDMRCCVWCCGVIIGFSSKFIKYGKNVQHCFTKNGKEWPSLTLWITDAIESWKTMGLTNDKHQESIYLRIWFNFQFETMTANRPSWISLAMLTSQTTSLRFHRTDTHGSIAACKRPFVSGSFFHSCLRCRRKWRRSKRRNER